VKTWEIVTWVGIYVLAGGAFCVALWLDNRR
jgi:hypothetical protein